MTEKFYNLGLRLLRSLPFMGQSFEVYPDCFSKNEKLLIAGIVSQATQRAASGEKVILVAPFATGFLALEKELNAVGADYAVGPAQMGVSDLIDNGIVLVLGNSLESFGEANASANWQLVDRLSGRLNVIVLQRHPLRSIDDAMSERLKKLPMHVRVGFFLSLDDPLLGVSVHETVVELLEQMGMQQQHLISSLMLTRRVRATQRRIAAVVTEAVPADSVQEWMDLNLPEPKPHRKQKQSPY